MSGSVYVGFGKSLNLEECGEQVEKEPSAEYFFTKNSIGRNITKKNQRLQI